ncbi:hypothetical protein PEDI_44560 [Persicobacter diffluens]|uniref:Beta-N-acetylhexosaminidase n=2 Tax=Persicobacter diffluens TaxID=981 RepID=A0AAN4W2W9_9BACT|nr:hypothetical protein PEDI_44560 [Persicobacter diffluens]
MRFGKLLMVMAMSIFYSWSAIAQSAVDVMPLPQEVKLNNGKYRLTSDLKLSVNGANEHLAAASGRFLRALDARTGLWFPQHFIETNTTDAAFPMQVSMGRAGKLELGEDESYSITITPEQIQVKAATDFGAMHAYATLLQLVESDGEGYYFPTMTIEDAPRFPWRGLMIDVARHFLPVDVIKRNLDGMAFVKMNVMHFHLSDNQGWRIESKKFPELTEKGSDGEFYTQAEIKDIVAYAAARGIRVMPEFDVPGHATAILAAFPEFGSDPSITEYQREVNAGIFDPTLDPTNEDLYPFLEELFGEMAALFPDAYFHIGGDENEGHHWTANADIQAFMKEHELKDNHELQAYFNVKVQAILEKNGKKMMGWEEIMEPAIPTTAVIHSWRGENEQMAPGESLVEAVQKGYPTVLSNGFYIDLLWKAEDHYLNRVMPLQLTKQEEKDLILGGEATMWSELVTPVTVDSRIWPRTAAIAERLWSATEVRDVRDMYRRLEIVSNQLEIVGLQHVKGREGIVRLLSGYGDTQPLWNLINVAAPLKNYTRNPGGTMYNSYFSFQKFADACVADAPDALAFRYLVEDYQAGKQGNAAEIQKYLELWKSNDAALQLVIEKNPVLKEVSDLSQRLAAVAQVGLDAMDKNVKKNGSWKKAAVQTLVAAREQGGRCELQVVDQIAALAGLEKKLSAAE